MARPTQGEGVRLWTWQGVGFDITSQRLDPTRARQRSGIVEDRRLAAKYAVVERLIGTNQILWCSTRLSCWHNTEFDARAVWHLDVPDGHEMVMLDSWFGRELLARGWCVPRSSWDSLVVEAADIDPWREHKQVQWLDQRLQAWDGPRVQGDDERGWEQAPDRAVSPGRTEVVLRLPIDPSWVLVPP